MYKSPKVSICIPAYLQTELLAKTLDSIIIQDYKDYEIIVTDDSPDDSVKKLVERYDFGGRLKYIKNQVRKGSPANWNEAIRLADGEYIKIMHHDDWFNYTYSLTEYVKLLDENSNIDIAFSASYVLFENGRNWIHKVSKKQFIKLRKDPLIIFSRNLIGAPSAVIYRKTNLILFDENLKWLVDVDFYIQKISRKNISFTDMDLVTTFGAEGRVTDICNNDKNIEIFEHFYILEKIQHDTGRYSLLSIKISIFHVIRICNKYSIKNISEIRNCNYCGKINWEIKIFLFINRFLSL